MVRAQPGLASNPDTLRWNARYGGEFRPAFHAHPLAAEALSLSLPDGPVLDLACGPSGSALLAASARRRVVAVDASDVALDLLRAEALRRGSAALIRLVHADLKLWRPPPATYSLVLCTGYWDRELFAAAADAVVPGGMLGCEAFTADVRQARTGVPADWCLEPGEPASLLPAGFEVLSQRDQPDARAGGKRQLLARRVLPRAGPGDALALHGVEEPESR